ncbi:unnamed protein product [Amoebophrya sp. A25]|nr:unnamed protein product [Amoebophrya sp. A25]|eukprot:GSA25T00021748001.1
MDGTSGAQQAAQDGGLYDDFDAMDQMDQEQQDAGIFDDQAAPPPPPQVSNRGLKTSAYMTKYERARILGTRATQISLNAPILVPLEGETDALEIAEKELRMGKIPFIIQRKLPNGETEEWKVSDLIDPH